MKAKPHVVVLGGNFAGLGSAQSIRKYAKDAVDITVVDRKNYLLFVPNIPAEVFEGRDPEDSLKMDLPSTLKKDDIRFVQGEVQAVDVDRKTVAFVPSERPGSELQHMAYDYLVVAVGSRLAYDRIEGFAEYGDTVSDFFHGNKLREKLYGGEYKGGPVVVGSARFHQGNGAAGVEPYPKGSIPSAKAACEGPPVEVALTAASWLAEHNLGGPKNVTITTPAEMIAEDAGEKVVGKLLEAASGMGFGYKNNTEDITRITKDGIEFANGTSLEAELKIVFPDWVSHDFLKGLPISDDQGFVVTDLTMRNQKYREVFAAGDCAAVTVPKLGAIGHQQGDIVGRQIAHEVGALSAEQANQPLAPVVFCIGDMGGGKGFYIRSNSWFGGDVQELRMGRVPFRLKMAFKQMFFATHGKMPSWGNDFAQSIIETVS